MDPKPCDGRDACQMMDDETIELIAERAAKKAVEKMTSQVYQEIGRGLVSKITYLIGVVVVGLALWLNSKGFLK